MEVAYFEFRIVLMVQVMATLLIDRAVYEASDACTMRLLFWCNIISSYILWQWFILDIHTLSNDIVILMYNYITLRTCRPRGEIRITSIVFFCFSAVTWIVYSQTDDTAISTETVERNLLLRATLFAVRQSWAYVALQTRCQNLLLSFLEEWSLTAPIPRNFAYGPIRTNNDKFKSSLENVDIMDWSHLIFYLNLLFLASKWSYLIRSYEIYMEQKAFS